MAVPSGFGSSLHLLDLSDCWRTGKNTRAYIQTPLAESKDLVKFGMQIDVSPLVF